MIYTTLNKISEHLPCEDGLEKLMTYLGKTSPDDDPLSMTVILHSNGLDDTLWCMRCVPEESSRWRLYVVWCARQVPDFMTDERLLNALDVAERYARGLMTDYDLAAARDSVRGFSWAARATRAAMGTAGANSEEYRDCAWYAAMASVAFMAARAAQKIELRRVLTTKEPYPEIAQ